MTAENMAEHRDDPNFRFWTMLKEGYDHFELTKVPPKVDVCGGRYVFNREAEQGQFRATAACPPMSMPDNLALAYQQMQSQYALAFDKAVAKLEGRSPAAAALQSQAVGSITSLAEEEAAPAD